MSSVRTWTGGSTSLHRAVEDAMESCAPDDLISESPYRRLARFRDTECGDLLVKEFRTPKGSRLVTATLGRDPAAHEWRMLMLLHATSSSVPKPHAIARLRDGRTWIVMEFLSGRSLQSTLPEAGAGRKGLMQKLGAELARLHAAGFVHGDLHVGNCLVTPEDRPILLDFRRARRSRSHEARTRDIGEFDFSLALEGVSLSHRLRFRMSALGLVSPLDPEGRERIRATGRASERHGNRYFRTRTRHLQRPGSHADSLTIDESRGLRMRDFSEIAVREALSAHHETLAQNGSGVLKNDHRARVTRVQQQDQTVVVKEVTKTGWRRRLADRLRGSPARRAWIGGHGLQARGIGAATPLAFVEETRMGFPVKSLVILEDLGPAIPAHALASTTNEDARRLSTALRRLTTALHRRGVIHGDFQAPHVFIQPVQLHPDDELHFETRLIDLEGVRFRSQLSRKQRIQALVELNASLADPLVPANQRRSEFDLYAQALSFGTSRTSAEPRAPILREIVRKSLARRHFWKGINCDRADLNSTSD